MLFPLIAVLNNPLNNSSQSDKKRRNNTQTSQKQMRSHNTRAITTRDGHFLCSVSNSFSNAGRGLFKYKRWIFCWKKCFYVWNLLIFVKLRKNYPNIKGRLRILKIIFKKMHFAVKLSVPVAVLFTLIDYCWLWQIFGAFQKIVEFNVQTSGDDWATVARGHWS